MKVPSWSSALPVAHWRLKIIALRWSAPRSVQLAEALTELAFIHREEGDMETSDALWAQALSVYQAAGVAPDSPNLGMQWVIHGVRRFRLKVFQKEKELYERLSHGQHPEVLFITCSDSRISTNHVTNSTPGELFVVRNAGNIVPKYDDHVHAGGEQASIEFAVNAIGVKDIIVCGHSHCGAMKGLLNPASLNNLPSVRQFLDHAKDTLSRVAQFPQGLSEEERLLQTVKANVLVQIEHLKTHPSVAAALSQGKLNVHGWVYRIDTGEFRRFNSATGSWKTL